MASIGGVGGTGPIRPISDTWAARPPEVPSEEVEHLEMRADALASLLEDTQAQHGKQLARHYAKQAAREAQHLQALVYQLIPATGVLPDQFTAPLGVPAEEVKPIATVSPDELEPIITPLPAKLVPQSGELHEEVAPQLRELPDALKARVATTYTRLNELLHESGLGEAMRSNAIPQWIDSH